MSNSFENNSYFGSARENELWFREELRTLSDEVTADTHYPDLEGKLLRDIAEDSARIDFDDLINPGVNKIIVRTKDRDFHYKPIGLLMDGLVVEDIVADEVILIRGTAYCLSLDTFREGYSRSLFNKHFLGQNYPAVMVEDPSLSVPFIAAKGQVGEYGYLVVSDMYKREDIEEILAANEASPRQFGFKCKPDGSLAADYLIHRESQTVQFPILEIDFE